jgi:hypothetical protein
MIELDENITCFNCKHFILCYYRLQFEKLIMYQNAPFKIIDVSLPGSYQRIYIAMASACKEYKKRRK